MQSLTCQVCRLRLRIRPPPLPTLHQSSPLSSSSKHHARLNTQNYKTQSSFLDDEEPAGTDEFFASHLFPTESPPTSNTASGSTTQPRPESSSLPPHIESLDRHDFFAAPLLESRSPPVPPPPLPAINSALRGRSKLPFGISVNPPPPLDKSSEEFTWLPPNDPEQQHSSDPDLELEGKPFASAVEMIRTYLTEHEFLNTQEIWKLGTDGLKPKIPAKYAYEGERIKMKWVSTMREQFRPWIPPAEARFPDHPFRSVGFLKGTILASLESQGLVRKVGRSRPLRTAEEFADAVRQAERETRRAERNAAKENLTPPSPKEPASSVLEYGWELGAARPNFKEWEKMSDAAKSAFEEEANASISEDRWQRAIRLEEQYHDTKSYEATQIQERNERRRAYDLNKRTVDKAKREEDRTSGRADQMRVEAKRQQVLDGIRRYAEQTGEDVSEWVKEVSKAPGEDVPMVNPQHLGTGAKPRKTRFGPGQVVRWRRE